MATCSLQSNTIISIGLVYCDLTFLDIFPIYNNKHAWFCRPSVKLCVVLYVKSVSKPIPIHFNINSKPIIKQHATAYPTIRLSHSHLMKFGQKKSVTVQASACDLILELLREPRSCDQETRASIPSTVVY